MANAECVIKITAGAEAGQQIVCAAAETILGRSPRAVLRFSSPSVSYEHAMITRRGEDYYLENLSANGTAINGERVTGRTRLRAKDQIRLGEETMLRVLSVPTTSGGGSARVWLLAAVVVMLILGLVIIILDPFSSAAGTSYSKAYGKLQEWTQGETAAGKLPPPTADMLREAWRLEKSGDRPAAAKAWTRLRILLAGSEETTGLQAAAQHHRAALTHLMEPTANAAGPSDEEMGAALLQFVGQMERRK